MPHIMDNPLDAMDSAMDGAMEAAMDAGMPVDLDGVDLFGDPLSLPTARPPSKLLLQRMDEMRSRGCCQKIAWSKQGTIASVSQDGRSLDLRYLRCRPEDGTWGMSEPTTTSQFGSGGRIVHLAWASTANPDLAVVDDFGRVSVLSCSITLNRPYTYRTWESDPVDDLHAVVGCYWLPLPLQSKAQYVSLACPAVRGDDGKYKYENSITAAIGPCHPNPAKSALLCVTSNGQLKLLFSQNNNKIQDTTIELEGISSSDEIITHAAICTDKTLFQPSQTGGFIFIALALASKQLRIIRASLNWGLPSAEKQAPLPQSHPLNPSVKETRVAYTSWLQNDTGASHLDSSMTQLSILEMIPPCLMQSQGNSAPNWSPALVFAVRSHVSAYSPELQSVVDVWQILPDQPQSLHPAFLQLSSRNGVGSNPPQATRLKRLDPIVLHKVVLTIHTLALGKVVCFAFSDGTVQYRDRFTMAEVYTTPDLDRIMTLNQMGFLFAPESSCVQIAFSPTNCSIAQVCDDGKVKWNNLRYPTEDIGSSLQDPQYAAVVAGLTVAVSAAAGSQTNYDDILAIARQFSNRHRFAYDWVMEVVRVLKIHVDYSEEAHHDQLVRNANLQTCLSILNHMGFRGEFEPRAFHGKFAMLTLHVRNIVILITIANNTPMNLKEKMSPLDEPEVVDALAGCVKWALELLAWLSDSLFNLQDDSKFMSLLSQQGWKDVIPYLQAKNEVSLHLLLCSSTRGFVSAACRRLLHLDQLSSRAIQYYEKQAATQELTSQNKLYQAYLKMQRYTSSSLVKVAEFDRLLTALGQDIRTGYHQTLQPMRDNFMTTLQQRQQQNQGSGINYNKQQQQSMADQQVKRIQSHYELSILLGNAPPPPFMPILTSFFGPTGLLGAFKAQTEPAKLFFAEYALLDGVIDDPNSLARKREGAKCVDIFNREEIPLVPDGDGKDGTAAVRQQQVLEHPQGPGHGKVHPQRRRCVRCASVMVDISTNVKPGFNFVVAQQRKCACGGNWGLLARGSTVG